jgi:hypothetical protein
MVVFGGDEDIGVKRSNFFTPALRVRFAVLMHYGGHRLIPKDKSQYEQRNQTATGD